MTPTQPSQAVEAAVQRIMSLADRYADSSAQVSLDKFVNHIDSNPARAVMLARYESLEAALRAELARPQEVAAPFENDPSYGDLVTALAECRDAFPVPGPGHPLEHEWAEAIGYPMSVPAYVKLAASRGGTTPAGNWSLDTSTGRPILMYENCSVIEGEQAQQVLAALAASRVPVASPAEPVPKLAGSPFESYVAQVIHAAFADGWGSCRDAEFAGDEAMNDAFNQSATLGVCLSIDQSPTPPVGAGGAGVMDARPETMEIRYETFGNCLWHTDCKVNSFKSGIMQVLSHEKTSSTMKCLSCGQVGAYPKGRVGTVCVPVISTDAAILAKGGDQGEGK